MRAYIVLVSFCIRMLLQHKINNRLTKGIYQTSIRFQLHLDLEKLPVTFGYIQNDMFPKIVVMTC